MLLNLISVNRPILPAPNIIVPIEFHAATPSKFVAAKKSPSKAAPIKKSQPLPQKTNEPVVAAQPSPSPESATSTEPTQFASTASTPAVEASTPVIAAPSIATQTEAPPALKTLPPPPASYLLDVVRTEVNVANPYYGAGEIRWEHDDSNYKMHIEVGVNLLFTTVRLYSMDSEGSLADTGVKPRTTTESRRGRSATATHFNYDSNTISFSATSAVLPMTDGAQDKATVLMQLTSIGNADPAQFSKGKEITIQVAEEKEANPYQFIVIDQETIETKLGRIEAWHVVRPPRPGVYSSRLDIWFAPRYNWLPVQIRNTESNGAITTQTIRKIIAGLKS